MTLELLNERDFFLVEGCFLLKDENLVFLGEVGSRLGWNPELSNRIFTFRLVKSGTF
jgi:hypothetical protein